MLILAALAAFQAPSSPPLMIFFDSGKAEIRREWEPVVRQAAALASGGQRLLIVGHSDTPGSPSVNWRVGLARAQAVAAALATQGVPARALELRSSGETELLVSTAEGVREVQNRRVTITPIP